MSIIFDDTTSGNTDSVSMEILGASEYLRPDKPETLESKSMVPYFLDCGMAEDHIVPGGLREYTEAVFKILGLSPSLENLKTILDRPDVKRTLESAIAAANKKHDDIQTGAVMPDMTFIKGVDETTMEKLVQKANKEEAQASEAVEESKEDDEDEVLDEPEALPEPEEHNHTKNGLCPRCGWLVDMPYTRFEISDSDRAQFAYSIMQRLPFKKTYELFNGQMSLTFRSRIPEDKELIMSQVKRDIQQDKYTDVNTMRYWTAFYEMSLLLDNISCPSAEQNDIGLKVKPEFKDYQNKSEPLYEFSKAMGEYIGTDALLRLIQEHFRTFESVYNALVDEALNENFYQPA